MKVFTVHEPPDAGGNRLERIAFVKEGFCWPALFVPAIWLIWRRMWWVLLGWLALAVAIGMTGELVPEAEFTVGVVSLVFTFWFALEANALRRWSLGRKGWRMVDIAAGADRESAEQSFFQRLARARSPARAATPGRVPPGRVPPVPRPAKPGQEPVIGLFPQPE